MLYLHQLTALTSNVKVGRPQKRRRASLHSRAGGRSAPSAVSAL